jgi:primosomal protein N' (replication factor Y)
MYDDLYRGRIDIAIGTQVVAKGLDLPHLRLVGVIQADSGLVLPDYSSAERTFQLLTQVIGRVGRSNHKTSVCIQTYKPAHPSITYGLSQDYDSFYKYTLDERRKTKFPPFVHLLKLVCFYKSEALCIKASKELSSAIRKKYGKKLVVLGPTPAFYEKLGGQYRWQIVIKASRRESLLELLGAIPSAHWQYELDPTSLL